MNLDINGEKILTMVKKENEKRKNAESGFEEEDN